GIDAAARKRITDPFFTTKREQGGTGLGLAISDRIVKDHGGSMYFESAPGKGTTVNVTFPLSHNPPQREERVS
ncbi:MAG: HAMP domain-containing histidine kinase, partial [Desulfosarcina sp.]|nr:HAMP domain-containing histidine kinase [Desulfosarcina sp.]